LCPDRFIRSYRLLLPAEIGKWEETAQQGCENDDDAARGVILPQRFFSMISSQANWKQLR
jgi:hypothetical protein